MTARDALLGRLSAESWTMADEVLADFEISRDHAVVLLGEDLRAVETTYARTLWRRRADPKGALK